MSDTPHALSDDALDEINRLWTIARVYSNTAHDVNNALQVISGSAELLLSREGLDERATKRLSAIRAQAGRAATMIGTLLSYARETDEALDTVDLAVLVEAAVAMRAASLGRAEIQVDVTRSSAEPCIVPVKPQKALQLLLNLLLTAEGSLRPGRGGRIDVRLASAGKQVVLTIAACPAEGEARGRAAARLSPHAPLFADVQRAAMPRLAASLGGTLSMPDPGDPVGRLTLTLPAAS